MKIDWTPLTTELSLWRAGGLVLPLWWRDDDAIAVTPALKTLTALADELSLPAHVAVIPKLAQTTLADFVADQDAIIPVVHGWQHQNHAPAGAKKAEFGHPRPDALTDATQALERMQDLFGAKLLPIFVPPWNRLDKDLLPGLAKAGYCGVSTYLPRASRLATTGLVQINTHIDPIFWRSGRGLVPPQDQIAGIVSLLQDRRRGHKDASEPLGFLTHHLVHTPEIWEFTRACLGRLLDGGAVPADLRALP
ncbi:polysaccharide deacetylase family protein [Sulfitobacter sp.]|uniref:polysaccharide deacetylase family protein n=1 Tax=Sulfitobacter sp. TaxID=1903071 RepID=UPI003F6B5D63